MPTSRTMPATKNAPEKDLVQPTMKPVVMGATTPIKLFTKLVKPPTVAVPPRGLISDTTEDATGAAAEMPDSAMEIQTSAQKGSEVREMPNTASPAIMPPMMKILRALLSSTPRAMKKSTTNPPIKRSASEAHIQGMMVKAADFRMVMCRVCTM